jgi:UDP-glucose 4-epimerase
VVGEGQNKNYMGVVPKFKDLIKSRAPITVYGDGEQTRDFVDVRDVVQAIILAMNVTPLSEKHTSFEIGSGRAVSVNHVVKALTKNKIGITVVHEPAKQEVRHSVANITEARKVLGYEPRYEVF